MLTRASKRRDWLIPPASAACNQSLFVEWLQNTQEAHRKVLGTRLLAHLDAFLREGDSAAVMSKLRAFVHDTWMARDCEKIVRDLHEGIDTLITDTCVDDALTSLSKTLVAPLAKTLKAAVSENALRATASSKYPLRTPNDMMAALREYLELYDYKAQDCISIWECIPDAVQQRVPFAPGSFLQPPRMGRVRLPAAFVSGSLEYLNLGNGDTKRLARTNRAWNDWLHLHGIAAVTDCVHEGDSFYDYRRAMQTCLALGGDRVLGRLKRIRLPFVYDVQLSAMALKLTCPQLEYIVTDGMDKYILEFIKRHAKHLRTLVLTRFNELSGLDPSVFVKPLERFIITTSVGYISNSIEVNLAVWNLCVRQLVLVVHSDNPVQVRRWCDDFEEYLEDELEQGTLQQVVILSTAFDESFLGKLLPQPPAFSLRAPVGDTSAYGVRGGRTDPEHTFIQHHGYVELRYVHVEF